MAELLGHLPLGGDDPVDGLHEVDWDPDGARLVSDGPRDGLADPPGGVGRELEALVRIELLDRSHQAEVPLLDEVGEGEAPVAVALGNRDDESQIRLDEL